MICRGVDVGEIDHGRFVAEVFQRHIRQVEMDVLEKQVCCDQYSCRGIGKYGGIVAHALDRRVMETGEIFCQAVNEPEFAER